VGTFFISVYKSVHCSKSFFFKELKNLIAQIFVENINLVVFGDFNININNNSDSESLLTLLNSYSLINSTGCDLPSTNYNTQKDICFNSINSTNKIKSGYFENLYSYHKPMWIMFNIEHKNVPFLMTVLIVYYKKITINVLIHS
jgi:hypothetical protein